jgi:two-component system NtrC family response regulator
MTHLLIVDDSEQHCDRLSSVLHQNGFQVSLAHSLREGLELGRKQDIDVVLLADLLTDGRAADHLQRFRSGPTAPEVIILAEQGDAGEAELAINYGAWDYIPKSTPPRQLIEPLNCLADYRQRLRSTAPSVDEPEVAPFSDIIGSSSRLRMCLDLLGQAAKSNVNVLLQGETGTGKEKFAVALHNASRRRQKNFVVVDCAALPETLVESTLFGHEKGAFTGATHNQSGLVKQADHGTLFLDEIGELPPSLQKSFLRVLEEHRFRPVGGEKEISSDFRLIAATNQDLDAMVAAGKFRSDLLFRLRTFSIQLPSLRERDGDLRQLADHFLDRIYRQNGIPQKVASQGFLAALALYAWPGNVRELLHALERSVAAAQDEPVLLARHLPTHIRIANAQSVHQTRGQKPPVRGVMTAPPLFDLPRMSDKTLQEVRDESLSRAEESYLRHLVATTGGKIKQACRISGLSRSRIYQLLKDYDIRPTAG